MGAVNTWAMLITGIGVSMLLGPGLARLAAWRTSRQPTDTYPEQEKALVAYVLDNPQAWVRVSTIEPDDLTDPACRSIWAALKEITKNVPTPESESESDIAQAAKHVPLDLVEQVRGKTGPGHVEALAHQEVPSAKSALAYGQQILDASFDRQHYQGRVALQQDESGAHYRPNDTSSVTRTALITVGLILSSIAAWASIAVSPLEGAAALGGWVILLSLGAGGVLWASVDIDTLYIDTRTFWPVTIALWLATALVLWLDDKAQQLLDGLIVFSAVLILFEGSNLLYRLIRKRNGMGGGDTKLALATIALPAALVGSWAYGYTIVLTALILAIAGWVMTRISGQGGKNIPFAFGPYLALAWCAAALAQYTTTLLGSGT